MPSSGKRSTQRSRHCGATPRPRSSSTRRTAGSACGRRKTSARARARTPSCDARAGESRSPGRTSSFLLPVRLRFVTKALRRRPTADLRWTGMRVGVIDVGSNTTRLLVASAGNGGLVPIDKAKVRLLLGEEIERFGRVSHVHVAAAAKAVRKMAEIARRERVESLDVFLTAPG